jgi:5-methyltetrahydropteroyltriglutamate--homocysteine methyltransferase
LKTTVIGAYPKIGDDPHGQHLRAALHKHDRGEIDDAALDEAYAAATRRAIEEQEAAGVDVVNDGQIRWDDLFAPYARGWRNVARGALERYYDNNTYFRQPTISGKVATDGRSLVPDLTFARSVATRELKAALCGPLTFATLAADTHYRSFEERLDAVTEAVAAEVRGLAAAGATLIDLEDPAVVAVPRHVDLARAAYARIAAAAPGVSLSLMTYFFPPDRVLEALAGFPVAQVGIDVRSRETTALRRLDAFREQTVVLGVVDARNTRLESEGEIASLIEDALKLVPAERLWVAPTTSLEYLPHDVAKRKLETLVRAARDVAGIPA